MPHQKEVVCKIYEGGKFKDGDHKETGFCIINIANGRASNNLRSKRESVENPNMAKIAEIAEEVLIDFCGGLRGEEILLTYLIYILFSFDKNPGSILR